MTDDKKLNDILLAANNIREGSREPAKEAQDALSKAPAHTESSYRGNEGFGEYTSDSDYIKGDPHFNDLTDFKGLEFKSSTDNKENKLAGIWRGPR